MKVIIVRHGQTTENAKTQDVGHNSEALLTSEGVMQAQKLGRLLKSENILHAYSSPQQRAIHTAQEILAHHPKVILTHEPNLKEQSLGIYEDAPKHVWKQVRTESKDPYHLFKPEGGESYAQVQARAAGFFKDLAKKHPNDTVLVVSHGVTTSLLLMHLFGKEINEENYKAYKPENTAFTVVEISDKGEVRPQKVNSLEHLNN